MRLGEIKIEALKLMFSTFGDELKVEDLPDLGATEALRGYLNAMNGSINRCFADIENKRVLPLKRYRIPTAPEKDGGVLEIMLSDVPDFFDIDSVICQEIDGSYHGDHAWNREGNVLILHDYEATSDYRLLYFPRLPRLTPISGDQREVDIPDEIAAFIPYFIKGDLYRDDEPDEAGEARNWYEAAMEQVMISRTVSSPRASHATYRQTEW